MKKIILILLAMAMAMSACAGDSVDVGDLAQEVTCTPDRGVWPCVGPEFQPQFEELAPAEDVPLWVGCQDISGARTCCVGEGDVPGKGYACCQACDKHGCSGVWCDNGVSGWH
jgi:hypothetical protein